MELRARPEAVRVTRSPGPGPRLPARPRSPGPAARPPRPHGGGRGERGPDRGGSPRTGGGDLGAGAAAAAGAAPRGVRRARGGGGAGEAAAAGPRVTRRPGRRAAGRARAVGGQAGGRAARTMPSFDEALQRAGEFGRFQRRVFLLLCLTGVTFAFLFVGVVFLGSQPDHYWCRGPSATALAERCGWSPEEEWNRTAPARLGPEPPERRGDGRCQRYLLEAVNASAAGPGALSCADPLAAFPNRSAPLVPCRGGWRYAQAHSTIISEVSARGPRPTRPAGRGEPAGRGPRAEHPPHTRAVGAAGPPGKCAEAGTCRSPLGTGQGHPALEGAASSLFASASELTERCAGFRCERE